MECESVSEYLYENGKTGNRVISMLKSGKNIIQVFEWETLRINENGFTTSHFNSLVKWQEKQKDTYFNVGYNKITFTQWVGVLQVGSLVIEVLPKADPNRYDIHDENRTEATHRWKHVLVEMLRVTGRLKLRTSDNTDLAVRNQSLFDLYFQSYLDEVETLIHRGLVKKYRRDQRNRTALKGKLLFKRQIAVNVIHKELFFTEAAVYDKQNKWNEILLAALNVTGRVAKGGLIRARARNLALNFPDWPEKKFTPKSFEQLFYDRKTEGYTRAISLARLILLQLNPQIASGEEKVVAILFDMNKLWEDWLLATYRSTYRDDVKVNILGKKRIDFWNSKQGNNKILETDILIEDNRGSEMRMIVLDAKWKRPGNLPSDDEIKQMFAYNLMWKSYEAWLLYPDTKDALDLDGEFMHEEAGTLGMRFINIFDEKKSLCRKLTLPKNKDKRQKKIKVDFQSK